MKRTLAAGTALALSLLLSGCGGEGDDGDGDDKAGESPSTPSSDTTTATDDETVEDTYATGADVADFCAALAEIDDAIDEAAPGDDADWERIVASFDALDEVGVPDDLPASGIDELSGVALLVRQSSSVAELNAAVEADPPGAGTIDDYIDDNCS